MSSSCSIFPPESVELLLQPGRLKRRLVSNYSCHSYIAPVVLTDCEISAKLQLLIVASFDWFLTDTCYDINVLSSI